MPREDDVILYALPVCAPYAVLAAYRYKAKLTPGSQKRGKAARQVQWWCQPHACKPAGMRLHQHAGAVGALPGSGSSGSMHMNVLLRLSLRRWSR